jgi:hypothetical protein
MVWGVTSAFMAAQTGLKRATAPITNLYRATEIYTALGHLERFFEDTAVEEVYGEEGLDAKAHAGQALYQAKALVASLAKRERGAGG